MITTTRNENSLCLLCEENKATKLNSHIIPKFMSKRIFGEENSKQGYILDTSKTHLRPQIIQDSPKENHFLCPFCEKYFEVLETYFSTRVHNRLWDIRYSSNFDMNQNQAGVKWKVCKEVDKQIFRLFIYSILWRSSVSNVYYYKDFKLKAEDEIALKAVLLNFKSDKQSDLISIMNSNVRSIFSYPFIIITAESFPDRTHNFIFLAPNISNPYFLVINDYLLMFSVSENETFEKFKELKNQDEDLIAIGFFSVDFWNGMRKNIMEIYGKSSIDNLNRIKKPPYY